MRKLQKQEILGIVATLYEAHEEIKNIIASGNYATAHGLLAQCQECAVSIGSAIEKSEGEGILTISYIEEYCDALYHAYEELGEVDGASAGKIYKGLKKSLLRVENSVRNDVPVRKEIAFFPYKASMWDSLESVYLKAKEDPTCDAYCVPIPYYDVNSDGSLGQMHYEGKEYPKNIEIIDWEKYDFENIKPDVAYIHNPYDDCNLVTRVHSRFYASNLKKYVGELIYIPYFILKEIEPNDKSAIDGMKHFIWTPGVVHADKVIVQSEKMAQIYRSEFRKAAIANGLPEKYTSKAALEKKILGLGSPKIEKVKNTKIEDLEIPQEWQKIINKPDGSRKKIVFYNTSIGALLVNNEKMLEKMKDVFRIFKENKDEIALLWRPHPLIENTVKAMRPQLWNEYKKIVEQYKAEGWGIYDDTADVDRAVVLSDAYYGDGSSVVQLYQQTGKPILIQAVKKAVWIDNARDDSYGVTIVDNVRAGDSEYMVSAELPWLLKRNKEGEISAVTFINENKLEFLYPYWNIFSYRNRIALIPYCAKEIAIYDIENNIMEMLLIPNLEKRKSQLGIFGTSVSAGNYIYAFGGSYEGILRIDMRTLEVKTITDDYMQRYKRLSKEQESYMFGMESCVIGEKAYIPVYNTNYLCEFNLSNESVIFHEISSKEYKFSMVCNAGNILWIAGEKGNILCWDCDSGELKMVSNYFEGEKDLKSPFFQSRCDSEHIYLYSYAEVATYTLEDGSWKIEKRHRESVAKVLVDSMVEKRFNDGSCIDRGTTALSVNFLINHLKKEQQ